MRASLMSLLRLSCVDRSFQTDARAKPVRPEIDTPSRVPRGTPRRPVPQPAEAAEQLRIRLGKHPVAEVEDVSGSAFGALEHVSRACLRSPPRAEEPGAVEVPLNPSVMVDPLPCDVERETPVDADDVAARGCAVLEQVR